MNEQLIFTPEELASIQDIFNSNQYGNIQPNIDTSQADYQKLINLFPSGQGLPAAGENPAIKKLGKTANILKTTAPVLYNPITNLVNGLGYKDAGTKAIGNVYSNIYSYLDKARQEQSNIYTDLGNKALNSYGKELGLAREFYSPEGSQMQKKNEYINNLNKYLSDKIAFDTIRNYGIASKSGLSESAREMFNRSLIDSNLKSLADLNNQDLQLSDSILGKYLTTIGNINQKEDVARQTYFKPQADSQFNLNAQIAQGVLGLLTQNKTITDALKGVSSVISPNIPKKQISGNGLKKEPTYIPAPSNYDIKGLPSYIKPEYATYAISYLNSLQNKPIIK